MLYFSLQSDDYHHADDATCGTMSRIIIRGSLHTQAVDNKGISRQGQNARISQVLVSRDKVSRRIRPTCEHLSHSLPTNTRIGKRLADLN